MNRCLLLLFTIFLLDPGSDAQVNLYVASGAGGTGSSLNPMDLQAALDSAGHATGDVVIRVARGTYYGGFDFLPDTLIDKDVTIYGGWELDFSGRDTDPSMTILDGTNTQRVLNIRNYKRRVSGDIVVDGFTIRNGNGTNGSGGGASIQGYPPGEVLVNNNIIEDNKTSPQDESYYHGGGLYVINQYSPDSRGGKITISNNIIRNNTAGYNSHNGQGGGLFTYGSDTLLVVNNLVYGNYADHYEGYFASGGGIEFYATAGQVILSHNTIVYNESKYYAGGVATHVVTSAWDNVHFRFYNNIIWGNTYDAWLGDSDIMSAVSSLDPGPGNTITIQNCNYAGLGRWPNDCVTETTANNINVDPQFTDGYRLKTGSGCIDAGSVSAPGLPSLDFDGNPRPTGAGVDIGAFENTGLVAWYPLDGIAEDASGNGNDGTVAGAIPDEDPTGKDDSAYHFDGTDDIITCGNDGVLDLLDQVSISAWFTLDSLREYWGMTIVSREQQCNHAGNYFLAINSGGQLVFSYYDQTGSNVQYKSESIITPGQWYHAAVTYNYHTYAIKLYLDGHRVEGAWNLGDVPDNYPPATTSNQLGLGGSYTYSTCYGGPGSVIKTLSGSLDDVRIYNRVLDSAEISGIIGETRSRPWNLSARHCNDTVVLTFDPYRGNALKQYYIYRDHDSPALTLYDIIPAGTGPDTLYLDTVSIGMEYYYRVAALDSNGWVSDPSNEAHVIPARAVDLGEDVELCAGEDIRLDAGGLMEAYQWSVPDSTGRFLTVSTPGDVWVGVTHQQGQCISYDTMHVTVHTDIVIDLGPDLYICPGDSVVLRAGEGYQSYNWSDGSTTDTLVVREPGDYSVTVKAETGCGGYDEIHVDTIPAAGTPEICLVTVSQSNKNMVVWEKEYGKGIDFYRVYREQSAGNYIPIGTVPFDSLSVYIDEASNPAVISEFYKIAAVDSCGRETDMSPFHKTLHLTANIGTAGEVNLIWEDYEGFFFSEYEIHRGQARDQMTMIASVTSSIFTYSDYLHPSGRLYYMIAVVPPHICTPTEFKSMGPFETAVSNIFDNGNTGLTTGKENGIRLYPNPAMAGGSLRIETRGMPLDQVCIRDLNGRIMRHYGKIQEQARKLDLTGLVPGCYILEFSGKEIIHEKLIIR